MKKYHCYSLGGTRTGDQTGWSVGSAAHSLQSSPPQAMRVFRQANVHDPVTDSRSGSGEGAEPGDGSIRWRMPSIGIETQSGR